MDKVHLCMKCHNNPATKEYHMCPYAYDVGNNDDQQFCDCCDECVIQCARDV